MEWFELLPKAFLAMSKPVHCWYDKSYVDAARHLTGMKTSFSCNE